MSQAEVAGRVGIAVEAYGRLERGAVLPRAETLIGLAYTFNVSTDELLGVQLEPTAHAASAHDAASRPDPDWRRVADLLGEFSPRTLRALGSALQAIREEGEQSVAVRR